jgi:hypothetical protein
MKAKLYIYLFILTSTILIPTLGLCQAMYDVKKFYGVWDVHTSDSNNIQEYEFLKNNVLNYKSSGNDSRQFKWEIKNDQLLIHRGKGLTIDRTIVNIGKSRIKLKDNTMGSTVYLVRKSAQLSNMSEQLLGTWKYQNSDLTAFTTFHANNQFTGKLLLVGVQKPISVTGTWRINGDKLISVVKNSSAPQVISEGHTSTDRIISISKNSRSYHNGTEIIKETRVDNQTSQENKREPFKKNKNGVWVN